MEELKALAIQDRGRKVLAVPEDWDGDDLALGYITKAPTTGGVPVCSFFDVAERCEEQQDV